MMKKRGRLLASGPVGYGMFTGGLYPNLKAREKPGRPLKPSKEENRAAGRTMVPATGTFQRRSS